VRDRTIEDGRGGLSYILCKLWGETPGTKQGKGHVLPITRKLEKGPRGREKREKRDATYEIIWEKM